ncbi:hypothetical protein [Goodfellowiella coeruleoviolacea]|uniref:Uncharacterized protein n=1 Tax=Goodfellowiella coeruleoviolacea TaxID=334858 RepID=A0AAE3GKZ2_9PSEU|nr:hypothetical protein [Goodfellowiella coeruleoviolacea]MCP2169194.1 hypothetical protein [Goodfellowiella coeruleoviolacea]
MTTCIVCERHDAGHRYACGPCAGRMRHQLRGIEVYAAVMAAAPGPMRRDVGRRSPGHTSTPPVRLDVVAALDRRSVTDVLGPDDDEDAPWSVPGTLAGIARYVAQQFGEVRVSRPDVTAEAGYLLAKIEACRMHRWVVYVAEDIRALHAQCRRLAGDQPPPVAGACLAPGCDGLVIPGSIPGAEAGQRVPGGRCNVCDRTYNWLELALISEREDVNA